MEESISTYEESICEALQITNNLKAALEVGEHVDCDASIETIDFFSSLITSNESSRKDPRIIEAVSTLMSSSTFDISPYVNNVEFISTLVKLLPAYHKDIASIISCCIHCNNAIIPWLLSSDSNFENFPENDEFLSLFITIHNVIKQCSEEIDTTLINQKAMKTIMSNEKLEPINMLKTVAILVCIQFVEETPEIMQFVHSMIRIIHSDESFNVLRMLGIEIKDDLDFVYECLINYETFAPCVRYLRKVKATKLSKEIIDILISSFDFVPYGSKVDIFYVVEPFATVLYDPEIIRIASFFIDDCPLGLLALKAAYLAFITMKEEDLEFCIDCFSEKEDELEEIEMRDSIDSNVASLILDTLRS